MIPKKNKIKEAESKRIAAENELQVADDKVKVAKQKVEDLNKDLGLDKPLGGSTEVGPEQRLKNDIKEQEAKVAKAESDFKPFQDDVKAKQDAYDSAQREFTAQSGIETALTTAISQILSNCGNIIKSGVNSVLVGQKAIDEARQKMTAADRENLNRIMDSLVRSIQKGGDIMSSLIQAIEKLANEHVNASSMSRN